MEKYIELNGQKLHYEVTGTGNPLILMHGWGCDLSIVKSIAETASETHTVYNIDMPGFGKSPEPDEVWGVGDYTDLMEKFIAAEQIERPILAGHSFGGRVAICLASRNDKYDALVLIDAAGIKPHRSMGYYYRVYTFKFCKALLKLLLGKEKAEKKIDAMRAKRGSSDYSQSTPTMRAILSKVVNEDLTKKLCLIKSPALLIWGENDTATPMADARKMEHLIPDAGLVSFPGCGHYSFLDNPLQFRAVLSSFLCSRSNR